MGFRSGCLAGQWRDDYEPSVQMLAAMYRGAGRERVAWNSALLYDMIPNQPVVYELPHLKVPTVLMVGDKDATAIGKDFASKEVQATLGHYPELARSAVEAIPKARLVEFREAGHAPQMQDPERFNAALLGALKDTRPKGSQGTP